MTFSSFLQSASSAVKTLTYSIINEFFSLYQSFRPFLTSEILLTFCTFFFLFIVLSLYSQHLKRQSLSSDLHRRLWVRFRSLCVFISFLILSFLWGGEIRTFFLSIAALAAALIIVSKEIISSIIGGLLFILRRPAQIGDYIQIGPHQGTLLDHHLFYTTIEDTSMSLQEGHPRSVKIPNSMFLTHSLSVISSEHHPLRLLSFTISLKHDQCSKAYSFLGSLVALYHSPTESIPTPQITLESQDKETTQIHILFNPKNNDLNLKTKIYYDLMSYLFPTKKTYESFRKLRTHP